MRSQVLVGILALAACSTSSQKDPTITDAPAGGSATSDAGTDGSSSGGNLAPNQSGSRIKMKVLSTPDGAKSFTGWYDTQRNEDCAFRLAEDGIMRCVPASNVIFNPDPHTVNGYYADANCQTPAVLYYTCSAPKYLSYSVSSATCIPNPTNGARVVTAGAAQPTAYQWGSNCQGITAPAGMAFYPMGTTVAPASFQSASEDLE